MLVNLARNWFGPAGSLLDRNHNPHEVPDEWKDQLPAGAEIVDEKGNVIVAADDDSKVADELSKKPSETKTDTTKK